MSVIRQRLADERGFTLIEPLVSAIAALIVSTATLAIVISAVHLSSQQQDRIDANQQGRLAMLRITQALNSSCVAASVAPILAGSDANHVMFYSAQAAAGTQSAGSTINPNYVTVTYNPSPTASQPALVMATGTWASGTTPANWLFNTATSFALLQWAGQATVGGAAQPTFQYYGYTAGTGTISTTPLAVPLSAANAAKTSMITVSFAAYPNTLTANNFTTQNGRAVDLTDSIVLRLTPASSAASASNAPCT